MIVIYKYPLEITESQILHIPSTRKILSIGLDPQGCLCVWAAVDPMTPLIAIRAYIIPTGCAPPATDSDAQFFATVRDHASMRHVYLGPDTASTPKPPKSSLS
jgi:hypothetical protein